MHFISFQKKRVELGEIAPGTIANYYKATKLFIEMNTNTPIINWKKISRGLPRGRKAAKSLLALPRHSMWFLMRTGFSVLRKSNSRSSMV
jgi:hypothetical protein